MIIHSLCKLPYNNYIKNMLTKFNQTVTAKRPLMESVETVCLVRYQFFYRVTQLP